MGALCAQTDPEVFFERKGLTHAKRICGLCPVRDDCLEEALGSEMEFGVWGGATAWERLGMLRELHGSDYNWPMSGKATESECRNGHLWSDATVMFDAKGYRRCRLCMDINNARAYAIKKAKRDGRRAA